MCSVELCAIDTADRLVSACFISLRYAVAGNRLINRAAGTPRLANLSRSPPCSKGRQSVLIRCSSGVDRTRLVLLTCPHFEPGRARLDVLQIRLNFRPRRLPPRLIRSTYFVFYKQMSHRFRPSRQWCKAIVTEKVNSNPLFSAMRARASRSPKSAYGFSFSFSRNQARIKNRCSP
jgi:hypothetical protein